MPPRPSKDTIFESLPARITSFREMAERSTLGRASGRSSHKALEQTIFRQPRPPLQPLCSSAPVARTLAHLRKPFGPVRGYYRRHRLLVKRFFVARPCLSAQQAPLGPHLLIGAAVSASPDAVRVFLEPCLTSHKAKHAISAPETDSQVSHVMPIGFLYYRPVFTIALVFSEIGMLATEYPAATFKRPSGGITFQ